MSDDALTRLDHHYQSMPPVAAMQLRIAGFDGDRLRLHAPLSAHVNDKGCAFGGSLGSMMTLASWGLVTLRIEAAGLDADVYVADSQVRYLAPLFADLDVTAEADADADWEAFIATLRQRGVTVIEPASLNWFWPGTNCGILLSDCSTPISAVFVSASLDSVTRGLSEL